MVVTTLLVTTTVFMDVGNVLSIGADGYDNFGACLI